ncbi:uncharacterized protein N7446_005501 [Penicillium canescens]|uniref:uncharacterized protein n=1 Tax=Penicillium canescens TaxID=5083 RepID=UPI0026E0DCA0|nr:uncharacterized protein N7446_005501 [Penicillium canescens]KAJ6061381.1 hypothetical protein N7446_005501 [Penicillium canescens]
MFVPNGFVGRFNGGIPVIVLAAVTLLTSQKMEPYRRALEKPVASMESCFSPSRVDSRRSPHWHIDFFLEYYSELSKKSKSGKPLWERKEKIFDWMGEKWHLGWATGWATSGDMLNDNGYRGQTIRQENRIRNDDYDIPFFRDSQMNPDDPREHRWRLIERMDGSEFRFLNDVTKCHEKAFQNGSIGSVEHLQERMASLLRTCDFMDHVKAQIHAEFGSLSFNLQDVRSLARTNKEIGEDLKKVISSKLLEETTTSQKLGDLFFPTILQAQEDSSTTSIDFLRDDWSEVDIFTWERTQRLRSKPDLAREKATRHELAQILEYTAEEVNLVEPPEPTVKGKSKKQLPKEPQEGDASEDEEAIEMSGANKDEETSGATESSEEDATDAESEVEMETLLTGPIPGCDPRKLFPRTMQILVQGVPEIGLLEGLWLVSQGADQEITNLRMNYDAPILDPVSKEDRNRCVRDYNRGYRILTIDAKNRKKVQQGLHKPHSKKTQHDRPTSSSPSQLATAPPGISLVNPLRGTHPRTDFLESRDRPTPPLSQSTPVSD